MSVRFWKEIQEVLRRDDRELDKLLTDFLTLWKDDDPDIPTPFCAAKAE